MMNKIFLVLHLFVLLSFSCVGQTTMPLVEADDLQALLREDSSIVVLDTRSPEEYQTGHLENARFVNYTTFQLSNIQDISEETPIVVYCLSGGRSGLIAQQLLKAGYQNVKNLNGGIRSWQSAGFNVEK